MARMQTRLKGLGGDTVFSRALKVVRTGWVSMTLLLTLIAMLWGASALDGVDRALTDLRYSILSRTTSNNTVLVQINPQSLHQLGRWPWSRALHAKAIEKLTIAGANRIAVDIDFSTPSDPDADEALAQAIQKADGKVVLPVFMQWADSNSNNIAYTAPIKKFADHARLGSVNVRPAPDGLVREYDRVQAWRDTIVPSFASEAAGKVDPQTSKFEIDFGIRISGVPRISFVDLIEGRFDRNLVAGKTVLIGATALELGDEIAVPVYGALSGVELQILAAESILQERAIKKVPEIFVLLAALVLTLLLAPWFGRASRVNAILAMVVGTSVLILGPMAVQGWFPLNIPSAAMLLALGLCFVYGLFQQLDLQAADLFKRAAEVRERHAIFESIVEANFDGIILVDNDDTVCLINPMAARLLKWRAEAAIGCAVKDILALPNDAAELALVMGEGRLEAFESTLQRADGAELNVEMVISKLIIDPTPGPFERRTQARNYTIYAFRDITERKKTEETIRHAAARAVEADRMKSEFIANMSHELRTPLNAIIGFSEVIKQEMYGAIGVDSYRSYAGDIHSSGTHLLSIINDLLEVSKIAAGKIELHDADNDLEQVFSDSLRIVRGYPGASSVVLTTKLAPGCSELIMDERSLRQILLNLLSNAIKFTPSGGRVTLSAKVGDDGGVIISIHDEGIGIPQEEIADITKPFHQVYSKQQQRHPGTGLGLHIVQSLMELHGGSIKLESEIGRGTRIDLHFPSERTTTLDNVVSIEKGKKKSDSS